MILLGDEGYDQSIVVSTVRSVVPDVSRAVFMRGEAEGISKF